MTAEEPGGAPRYAEAIQAAKNGDSERAIAILRELVTRYPEKAEFSKALGAVYFDKKNYPEAEKSYRKSLALGNDDECLRGLAIGRGGGASKPVATFAVHVVWPQ